MSFNFPTAPQVNRQQAILAGGGAIVILAALGWFFFLRPVDEAPAADTPVVSAAARARAAREAAIRKRQAAAATAATATPPGAANAPGGAKDSAAASLARKDAARPGPATTGSAAPKPAPVARDSAIVVMREDFAYEAAGRRDPFVSLMSSDDLRPAVSDLRISGILWHPTRPVAMLRDLTGKEQYRVTVGSVLGRMRVTQIKPKVVIFTIEEFGFNRRDSLILGDTTQVRAR